MSCSAAWPATGASTQAPAPAGIPRCVISTTVDRQRRAATDVAGLRKLAHRALLVACRLGLGREHAVAPFTASLPLRAGRHFQRAHVGRHVHTAQVESQRRDATFFERIARRRNDLVVGAEHRFAHADNPRVRDQVHKAAEQRPQAAGSLPRKRPSCPRSASTHSRAKPPLQAVMPSWLKPRRLLSS